MANKESTFTNMLLTLVIVATTAGLALGGVHLMTKEKIELNQAEKLQKALNKVLPDFDNEIGKDTLSVAAENSDKKLILYKAKKGDELVGVAVETYSLQGYSGLIKLLVGFDLNGNIQNISVLQHAETPGLGDKMQKDKAGWSEQFNGKNPAEYNLQVKKDGGDVDAITAATISSRAYCDAVQRAWKAFDKHIKGGQK